MEVRPLQFVATGCAGELVRGSPEARVARVCTDSREVQPGDLFFALRGERFDGHDFLTEVARKAGAAVVERRGFAPSAGVLPTFSWNGCAIIVVENTRQALGRFASEYRKDFALPMVVVGGSNGKTTTKELLAAVLRQRMATLWSEASFNNDIGVPMTLLKLETNHRAAVLEVGTNHPGELEPLVRMVQPDYGVITNIGREHLEFFGDVAGVAREEGMLAELLPFKGKLFLNGDDEWSTVLAQRTRAAVVRVGFGEANDWRVRSIRPSQNGLTVKVQGPQADFAGEFRLNLLGRHQAINALFAIALGAELGLSRTEIERGLAECKPAKMRLQLWEANGVRVLDDAYNANADSMAAALLTLQELPCKGRRVAVLGDMAELGAHSTTAHEEIGQRAAELGIGQLFAVGKMAPIIARGARAAGLNRILEFADVDSAGAAVRQFVKSGDLVLLKASRAMRLERIAEQLRAADTTKRAELHFI